MKYLYTTLAVICVIPIYSAFSQDRPKVVTLNECITIAVQNNPSLMASDEDKKKALADYRVANAQRNIFINAEIKSTQYPKQPRSSRYSDLDAFAVIWPWSGNDRLYYAYAKSQAGKKSGNVIDNLSDYYSLGISFGIVAGVSLYNEKNNRLVEQARSGIKLADLQAKKVMADVIFNVKKAYYSYILAQENVLLQQKLLKYTEDRLRLTEVFYKNAQKQLYELSKAKYDYSDAQLQLQKAINTERAARIDLIRAMGITDEGAEFVLDKRDAVPELSYSLDDLYKLGELNYPDMQIVKMQKEISKIKVSVEKAGHYPQVDLQLGAAYENGQLGRYFFDPDNWKRTIGVGFVAKIPIYSGGMVSARVDSAETEYNKMVYKMKDASVNLRLLIQSNYTTLQELTKQLAMAKLAMENAEKHFRLSQKLYESGTTTMLELNDASVSRVNSELSYLKTRYDYLMTIAKISSIVGLGEDSLCKK